MYASTSVGQAAQIRQLNAELHIEGNPEVIISLHQFMSKVHFIAPKSVTATQKQKLEEIAKTSGKVMFFGDLKSYSEKVKVGLSR